RLILRFALCNEVIRHLDFRQQCTFARLVGYDGLELAPFTLGSEPHRLTVEEVRILRNIAASEGVSVVGVHWLLAAPEGLSITTEDDEIFARTLDVGRALIDVCGELGGTYVVHGSPAQRVLEPGREARGRARAIDYFSEMAKAAERANISYCLEPLARASTNFIITL